MPQSKDEVKQYKFNISNPNVNNQDYLDLCINSMKM